VRGGDAIMSQLGPDPKEDIEEEEEGEEEIIIWPPE
jgi:hypothetical protein